MINIVAIDPSLISTGMTINGSQFSIASESIALTKTLSLTKWFDAASECCEIHPINTNYKNEKSYAKLEINKLETYQKASNLIRKLVDKHCNPNYNTVCLIEGYSYSSQAGPLIDLVTFGTMVRRQLFTRTNTELVVLAPSTVKKLSAELTYKPVKKGRKLEYRNNEGVAGGNFKKPDIYRVLTENKKISSRWVKFLRDNQDTILKAKSIPKPIEDVNDSVVMYYIAEKAFQDNNQDFLDTVKTLRNT